MARLIKRRAAALAVALGIAACLAAGPAEARRGGSFGSRGSRTYYSPRSTNLAPGYVPPVSRSMTARPGYGTAQNRPAYDQNYQAGFRRPGLGGGLLTGLVAGGLIGSLFGHHAAYANGYGGGGGSGLLGMLVQLAILGGLAWLVFRLFRGRRAAGPQPGFDQPMRYQAAAPNYGAPPPAPDQPIAITPADQASFERLLGELQDAFAQEDYRRLRAITTPEAMSYLAEELSDNATHNRRNDVTRTRLLDGEVSEAWEEAGHDYATVAMRYESVDVMRDRVTQAVLAGDPSRPTVTTELWTFVRPSGTPGGWQVSAIQQA